MQTEWMHPISHRSIISPGNIVLPQRLHRFLCLASKLMPILSLAIVRQYVDYWQHG
jgi:nitrate reductase NapE component